MNDMKRERGRARAAASATVLAAALALLVLAPSAPALPDGPSPGNAILTRAVAAVKAEQGRQVRLGYRIDAARDQAVQVELVVETPGGRRVATVLDGEWVRPNAAHWWRGKLRLPAGRYVYLVHAVDGADRSEVSAAPARLVVVQPLVPRPAALRAAAAWARGRLGQVSFAVVDSRGALHGLDTWRGFRSASVVKAMLLVAYLRTHDTVSADIRYHLTRMIEHSDNASTDVIYRIVGRRGLDRLATTAGMRGFRTTGAWMTTRITAGDMARFFLQMDEYIPARHRRLAHTLLAGVTPSQRWGIPPAAEPRGYKVYFKGGWLGAYLLASQAGRLERNGLALGLCVCTDGNPGGGYGPATIEGITTRLLER